MASLHTSLAYAQARSHVTSSCFLPVPRLMNKHDARSAHMRHFGAGQLFTLLSIASSHLLTTNVQDNGYSHSGTNGEVQLP